MSAITIKNVEFKIDFSEEIDGTYVVDVEVSDRCFSVNCQTSLDHNYRQTDLLSCINESGSCIADSGLLDFVENVLEFNDDELSILERAIEEEAQEHYPKLTVTDYINEKFEGDFKFEKGLAGACYAPNRSLNKYIEDDGRVLVVAEDADENIPSMIVGKCREFENADEYKLWFDQATKEHTGHWSGDFTLALMLYEAL